MLKDLSCSKNGDFDLNFVSEALKSEGYTVEHYSFNENKDKTLQGEYNPKHGEKVMGYIMHIGAKNSGHYTAIINSKFDKQLYYQKIIKIENILYFKI